MLLYPDNLSLWWIPKLTLKTCKKNCSKRSFLSISRPAPSMWSRQHLWQRCGQNAEFQKSCYDPVLPAFKKTRCALLLHYYFIKRSPTLPFQSNLRGQGSFRFQPHPRGYYSIISLSGDELISPGIGFMVVFLWLSAEGIKSRNLQTLLGLFCSNPDDIQPLVKWSYLLTFLSVIPQTFSADYA